jgi:hypothetical protein
MALSIFEKVLEKKNFWLEFVERPSKFKREFAFPKIRYNAGYRFGFKYDDATYDFPSSPVVLSIDCSKYSLKEVQNINSQFKLKIARFLWQIYGANDAGSFGWILRSMPKLAISDTIWNDTDSYEYFDFSEDQIKFIEDLIV